ncbi:MAG: shikimate kinase [bacterium]
MGFMASGKSAVGRHLARRLGWTFLDADREVEAEAGRSIPRIFAEEGEDAFRRHETEVMQRLLARRQVVLASGGGWPCREGRLERLPEGTLSVWLRVSPREAVARASRSSHSRPLLDVERPGDRARELLAAREPFYRKAHLAVDTEGRTPGEVAREIARHLD